MARSSGLRCIALLVRALGSIIIIWGVALLAYGCYAAAKFSSSTILYGSLLGLGSLNTALALTLVTCGYRSLFFLRLYGLVQGLLEIAEAAIAALFMIDSERKKILDGLHLPDDLRSSLDSHLNVAGPLILTIVALQLVVLAAVACQCAVVERTEPEEDDLARTGLLSQSATKGGVRAAEPAVGAAAARYKERTSEYRQKYGIGLD